MTETRKDKNSNKSVHQDFAPDIAKMAKKKVVSLLPVIAISIGLFLLLLAFFYLFYFKDIRTSDFTDIKKIIPEITRKEFSFKKAVEEEKEPVEEIKRPLVKLNPDTQEKAVVLKPVFQKYKSIPVKSQSPTSASDTTSSMSPAASTETDHKETRKETRQETNEAAVVAEKSLIDPHFLIAEGTYIPCSLTTKFTSDVSGRITCTIAEDIFGANGAVKLIERGTRAIGSYQGGNLKQGMGRMFVIWTKLITPDFKHIKLVDSQVVGQLGESGIDGWIDSHFFKRFGGAILLSTAKDILKMTQQQGQKKEGGTSVNINTMDQTKDAFVTIIEKMLESSINIPPTMYKNQGDIVGILVGRDIDFSKVYKLKVRE